MSDTAAPASNVVAVRQMSDYDVVALVERVLLEQSMVDRFASHLEGIVRCGDAPKIIVSFAGVKHMSSSVLGAMIATHMACERQGGELRVAAVSPSLMEVFKVARLDKMLRFYRTVELAEDGF